MTFYTVQETSEILKVEEDTVRRWVNDGKLKGSRLGGNKTIRINENAILDFVERNTVCAEKGGES